MCDVCVCIYMVLHIMQSLATSAFLPGSQCRPGDQDALSCRRYLRSPGHRQTWHATYQCKHLSTGRLIISTL
ncbi:hypothetical protein F4861DRAFT_269115 [Xylaria intraflava]|nr:hypothetical protein F4861DRAFT_269115 [Xylaria intraflava]